MKKIFIEYNPYMVKTIIYIDSEISHYNSTFIEKCNKRLQEWVDDIPEMLCTEYNEREFNIIFHGTSLDFEDLKYSLECYSHQNNGFTFTIQHTPAKEVRDKETKIQEVFAKIQSIKNNPDFADLQDLTSPALVDAFNSALNNEFEVFVVATMSAGKSTLINALLGHKLMPAKQEACTAIITRIKDVDSKNTDASYQAVAYDNIAGGAELETSMCLRLEDMERLNNDHRVRRIEVTGDIPFVTSSETSLVLIDTPGPNNSRTEDHASVQRQMLDNKAKPLILYVMTGEFGTNDDVAVLQRVAKSMSSGGKQARDRFLFVINKLDGRKKEDGDLGQFLKSVKSHLELNDIPDPTIFPAAALPALNIRLLRTNPALPDEDECEETKTKIRKFNRTLHFEEKASLPLSLRADINQALANTRHAWENDNGAEYENPTEALIHTGIPSIEAAIRQYVEKYAKTAKIKNLVDTFMSTLQRATSFEELKKYIVSKESNRKKIRDQIEMIRNKIDDIENAKSFQNQVEQTKKDIVRLSYNCIDDLISKLFTKIADERMSKIDKKIDLDEIDSELRHFRRFAEELQKSFQVDIDDIIHNQFIDICNHLVEEYKKYITSLSLEFSDQSEINIDPLQLLPISLDKTDKMDIDSIQKSESIKSGKEWVENTNKKWYKPWTWFDEKGYWRTKYIAHIYIPYEEFSQKFYAPVQENLFKNGENAKEYVSSRCDNITEHFQKIFDDLNLQLKNKLRDLDEYTRQEQKTEKELERTKQKLAWLEGIQNEIKDILKI